MESLSLQHVNAKIYLDAGAAPDLARVIEIFHRWISQPAVEELLIDVADYRHVPDGPGVLLVGVEADYSLDQTGHRPGLRYNRKATLAGTNEDRLGQSLRAAARACLLLENEPGGEGALRFSRREFELLINDRALAPNTPESREAVRPLLDAFLKKALGHREFSFEFEPDPRKRLAVVVKSERDIDLAALAGMAG